MHIAYQFEIDWQKAAEEAPLKAQWKKNRMADAHNWTDEAMARHWAGFSDLETWQGLPRYERSRIVEKYQYEQSQLESAQENWVPVFEIYFPDGHSEFRPKKPSHIRCYGLVCPAISQKEIDDHFAHAQELADQITADWSVGRPPSVRTYDPILASTVSMILGKRILAVEAPKDAVIPISWRILTALQDEKYHA